MLTDHRCTKYTDCSSCSFYQRDIFKYRLYPKVRDPSDKMHAEHGLFPSQGRDLAEQRGAPGHYVPGRTVRVATDRLESGMQGTRLHRMYHLSLRRPQNICDNRFNKGISIVENERQQPIVMTMSRRYNSSSRA